MNRNTQIRLTKSSWRWIWCQINAVHSILPGRFTVFAFNRLSYYCAVNTVLCALLSRVAESNRCIQRHDIFIKHKNVNIMACIVDSSSSKAEAEGLWLLFSGALTSSWSCSRNLSHMKDDPQATSLLSTIKKDGKTPLHCTLFRLQSLVTWVSNVLLEKHLIGCNLCFILSVTCFNDFSPNWLVGHLSVTGMWRILDVSPLIRKGSCCCWHVTKGRTTFLLYLCHLYFFNIRQSTLQMLHKPELLLNIWCALTDDDDAVITFHHYARPGYCFRIDWTSINCIVRSLVSQSNVTYRLWFEQKQELA